MLLSGVEQLINCSLVELNIKFYFQNKQNNDFAIFEI